MMSVQATAAAAIGSCTCDDPHLSHLYWYRCPFHCRQASLPQPAHAYNAPRQHHQNQQPHHQAQMIYGGSGTGADDDRLKQWLEDLTAAMLPWMVQDRCYCKDDDTDPLGSKPDDDHDHHLHEMLDYERLTSFLRPDNSFLTPWNWKPDCDDEQHDQEDDNGSGSTNEARKNDDNSNGAETGGGGFMQFLPTSFSYYYLIN